MSPFIPFFIKSLVVTYYNLLYSNISYSWLFFGQTNSSSSNHPIGTLNNRLDPVKTLTSPRLLVWWCRSHLTLIGLLNRHHCDQSHWSPCRCSSIWHYVCPRSSVTQSLTHHFSTSGRSQLMRKFLSTVIFNSPIFQKTPYFFTFMNKYIVCQNISKV